MGEHEMANPYDQRATQGNPNRANAHLLLDLSNQALKRVDLARAYLEKALELEPGHPLFDQIKRWVGENSEGR